VSEIGRVVIVGGGQAGAEAAAQLRARKFSSEITLIGEENLAPYQRPPLSKAFLAGELPEDRLPLRPPEIYAEEQVSLLLGRRVTWIDRAQKHVRLDGGGQIPYDALILATGAKARPLPSPAWICRASSTSAPRMMWTRSAAPEAGRAAGADRRWLYRPRSGGGGTQARPRRNVIEMGARPCRAWPARNWPASSSTSTSHTG